MVPPRKFIMAVWDPGFCGGGRPPIPSTRVAAGRKKHPVLTRDATSEKVTWAGVPQRSVEML